ncbi:MAG: zinc-binding dehydrogenase, partial [Selenomonadaceae bacterium]|nr:zinc-binding dehydrogenase [Selenomonadaceae bacterium]
VFPLIPCGKCDACTNGDYAQCADYDYYGSRRNGAMAEYLAVKVKNLCQIPNNVSFEEAAMTEPAAVAIHAFRKSGAKANDTILIYGIGTIGLILGEWARVTGVKNVIMVGRSEDKIEFAKKLGFPLAINTTDIKEKVMEVTKGRGVDVCIEGTGVSKALEDCISAAKNFGTVLCLGNPEGKMTLSQNGYWKIMRKELRIVGTWNSSFLHKENDWETALLAMKEGKLKVKPLITHRFGLAEYEQAFDLMKERREMFCKVMFVR